MEVVVRRVGSDDWAELKEVRLAALAEAPYAFGSSYAAEVDRPDEEWKARASRSASGSASAMFLARGGHDVVGIAGGYRPEPVADEVEVVSMWTAPSVRRSGVGRLLIEAVVAWAGDVGAASVSLWVTEGNDAAAALYRSTGFRLTDARQPLPSNPTRVEAQMTLTLSRCER